MQQWADYLDKLKAGNASHERQLGKASNQNHSDLIMHDIPSKVKTLIVGAACWGVIPFGLASWLIKLGGLQDA